MTEAKPRGRSLGPVLLTVLLDLLGFGLVIPLLSFYAEDYGATPLQVTLLMAVYSIAQFVFAPVWGSLSDRIGRRPVMLLSIAGSALALSGFALATTVPMLFLFRGLHGMCAANISTAQAYVADVTTPENRARGMGLIGASFGLGFSLGPWLGGELSAFGLVVPIWTAAGLSALNFAWALFGLPESRPVGDRATARRPLDPRALWKGVSHPVVGAAIALTFAATFAFALLESTFALVAEHSWDMGAQDVGRLFGLIGVVGIVIQGGLIGRLVARFGERILVIFGYLCTASGLVTLGLAPGGLTVWGGCTLIAIGQSVANPSLQSLISRAVSADEQGAILGVNQSLGALARATAPPLGGTLYTHVARGAAMLVGGAVMGLALLLAGPATRRARDGRLAGPSAGGH
jgi:DHA1 family tetracycline resistance protein-like MFS transporter